MRRTTPGVAALALLLLAFAAAAAGVAEAQQRPAATQQRSAASSAVVSGSKVSAAPAVPSVVRTGVRPEKIHEALAGLVTSIQETQERHNVIYAGDRQECDILLEELDRSVQPLQQRVDNTTQKIVALQQKLESVTSQVMRYDREVVRQTVQFVEITKFMNESSRERQETHSLFVQKRGDYMALFNAVMTTRKTIGTTPVEAAKNSTTKQDVVKITKLLTLLASDIRDHIKQLNLTEIRDAKNFQRHFDMTDARADRITTLKEVAYQSKRKWELDQSRLQAKIDELQSKLPDYQRDLILTQNEARLQMAECDNFRFEFITLSKIRKEQLSVIATLDGYVEGITP